MSNFLDDLTLSKRTLYHRWNKLRNNFVAEVQLVAASICCSGGMHFDLEQTKAHSLAPFFLILSTTTKSVRSLRRPAGIPAQSRRWLRSLIIISGRLEQLASSSCNGQRCTAAHLIISSFVVRTSDSNLQGARLSRMKNDCSLLHFRPFCLWTINNYFKMAVYRLKGAAANKSRKCAPLGVIIPTRSI